MNYLCGGEIAGIPILLETCLCVVLFYVMLKHAFLETKKTCYIIFFRNLIADIFGESGDEEEEEFTVSVFFFCLLVISLCVREIKYVPFSWIWIAFWVGLLWEVLSAVSSIVWQMPYRHPLVSWKLVAWTHG